MSEYYYLGSILIATRSFFYYGDHLQSERVMTDTTGHVQWESDYYAYGGELNVTNLAANDRKFNSKRRDSETSFDYAHVRMLDASLGRWISTDPAAGLADLPQSLNRYVYVLNDPSTRTDSTGAFFDDLQGDLFGGGGDEGDSPVVCPDCGGSITVTGTPDPIPLDNGPVVCPYCGGSVTVTATPDPIPTVDPPHRRIQPRRKPNPHAQYKTFGECCGAARAARQAALLHALGSIVPGAILTAGTWVGGYKLGAIIAEEGGFEIFHGIETGLRRLCRFGDCLSG